MNQDIKIGVRNVRAYRWGRWSVARCLAMVFCLFGIMLFWFAGVARHNDAYRWGCLASFLCFIIFGSIEIVATVQCPREISNILDRWKAFSDRPVGEFPTAFWQKLTRGAKLDIAELNSNSIFLASYIAWAKARLVYLATILNAAYAWEEAVGKNRNALTRDYAPGDFDPQRPSPAAVLCGLVLQGDRDTTEMRPLIEDTKTMYLGFWNLVTLGRETEIGLGILTGPGYGDPDVFRKDPLLATAVSNMSVPAKKSKSASAAKTA